MLDLLFNVVGIGVLCFASMTFGFALGERQATQESQDKIIEAFDKGKEYARNAKHEQ